MQVSPRLFKFFAAASTLTLMLSACGNNPDQTSAGEAHKSPEEFAAKTLIIDTHIDVPYRLAKKFEDVTQATEKGEFDTPRAEAGGLNAPFMSIYTPADLGTGKAAYDHASAMIDIVEKIVATAPDKYIIPHSAAEMLDAVRQGLIALPLGMENGAPIGLDLANLKHFYDRGVRYVTLAHSKANQISDSSYDPERPNKGLSEFGHIVVRRMNQLGIMVDVSHISDDAFYNVMTLTKAPVIASHSSARHFTPGFERNMSDEMIRALARNGGVIMVNFGSAFLNREANEYNPALDKAYAAYLSGKELDDTPERKETFTVRYRQENPYPYATLDDVLDHIDHIVRLVGAAHVGIGSDYDGVGDSLPVGLKDVSTYPNLIKGLRERGYKDTEIEQILGLNLLRVWQKVETIAALESKL